MKPKFIVTGGARLSGLREKRRLLNPLDLIWFVPAWGSKGFIIVDETIIVSF
jgi:hypothetical protein